MLNVETIMNWAFEPIEQAVSDRDCLLYALSLGYGRDPMDAADLAFVYEKDLRVVPTISAVLAKTPFWMRDPRTGIDWVKIVHGEQSAEFLAPVPTSGTLVSETRVKGVEDKGPGKGALVFSETSLWHKETGTLIAVNGRTSFCRGDGGCGSAGVTGAPAATLPGRAADHAVAYPTEPWLALLYRLNGDRNPLHADPEVARKAGFERPILHGLCTWGLACRALLATCCGNDPARLRGMRARFSAPVLPGETIETRIWTGGDEIAFECRVPARDATVLKGGVARLG